MSQVNHFDGQISLDFISFLKAEPNGLLWEEVIVSCSVMLNVNKSIAQKDAMGTKTNPSGYRTHTHLHAHTHTCTHAHTYAHTPQFIDGMKKKCHP